MTRHRVFTIAMALSIFLATVVGMLWAASYFVGNSTYQRGPRIMFLRIDEGDNYLFLRPGAIEEAILGSLDHQWATEDIYPFWKLELGLLLSSGICFVIRGFSNRDRFAMVPGVCRVCGYDLRASSERCPECGATNRES